MRYIYMIVLLLLAGCSNNSKNLYFADYTRIGIDASKDGVGIGVKSAALTISPTAEDGSAFNVLGTSDIDLSYTGAVIKEVFAVGEAAEIAAKEQKMLSIPPKDPKKHSNIIFGTYSSWSLMDLSWGDTSAAGVNFGYKRGTGVKIPVVDDHVGSIYAEVSVNNTSTSSVASKSNLGGTRNIQVFATGNAAKIMASKNVEKLTGKSSSSFSSASSSSSLQ